jgi:hypothetical protein
MGLNISHDKDILKPRSDNKFDNFSDNYVYTVEDFKNGIANVNIDHFQKYIQALHITKIVTKV